MNATPGFGPEAAAKLLADNRQQFIGHPERTAFLAGVARATDNDAAGDAVLRQAITAGTEEWNPYFVIGRTLVQSGKYAEAANVFLRFPGFKPGSNLNSLSITNKAYDAGSLLYWIGQYEAALPLYQLAASINNGSDASQASAIRLALLDGDLDGASEMSLSRAQQYDDDYAYRDFIALLYGQGQSADADALFDSHLQGKPNPQMWDAALVGHRLRGSTSAELQKWVSLPIWAKAAAETGGISS